MSNQKNPGVDQSGQNISNSDATTIFRYMATFEEELVLPVQDKFSRLFLSGDIREKIESPVGLELLKKMSNATMPGIYEFVVARTIHYDNMVMKLIEEKGVKQLVIMGAGFDSRPYRFEDVLAKNNIAVFELDLPHVQELKLSYLREFYQNNYGKGLPENIKYIPTDFDHVKLTEQLLECGYQPELGTMFLWEGVTPYLSTEGMDATLKSLSRIAAKHSMILFDAVWKMYLNNISAHIKATKSITVTINIVQLYIHYHRQQLSIPPCLYSLP